ncbi:hypothetical protein MKZ38_004051 [Zalerion maritima]|uniref:Pre-mRNA-splicing factor CWC26 n=1 Tax=Zalerion maritima TaxID=339359 RepID=A0AAD5RLY5_9PEZI|nr:hypothetical protein MKZ38_004051 [Zalerion maritima]
MPSDLASYLASNYLTVDAPKSKIKKRKRKQEGLIIADDNATGWASNSGDAERDEIGPVVASTSAEFAKTKKSNWKKLNGGLKTGRDSDAEAAAADAILALAAVEIDAARETDGDAPVVDSTMHVDSGNGPGVQKMNDGTLAGLQTAASLAAETKKQRKKDMEAWEREKGQGNQETAYRDATGNRVDVSMQREDARKAALEAEDKERLAVEALRGEVQIEEAKLKRAKLAQARNMALARKVDDEDMNKELKEKERWNDPMARFLAEKQILETKKARKGRPVYTGSAPPNRYGIRPGYRWDGVDRGNGFEAERFKALNRKERNKGLEYSWQLDE